MDMVFVPMVLPDSVVHDIFVVMVSNVLVVKDDWTINWFTFIVLPTNVDNDNRFVKITVDAYNVER